MKYFNKVNIINFTYMVFGTFLFTVGINSFIVPNEIVAGGTTGIGVILYHLFGIAPETTLFVSNLPLLLLSLLFIGKKYTLNTIFCSFLLPFFIKIFHFLPKFSEDMILASIFGGILAGLGTGLIFKSGSSNGGTAIIEQILHDKLGMTLGTTVLLVDGSILCLSFFFFNISVGLYSVITLFIIGKVIDIVQSGGIPAKTTLIISNKNDEISSELIKHLEVGVTVLSGQGAYSKEDKDVLLCTFPEKKILRVKNRVFSIDPNAFFIVIDAKEVIGNRWQEHLV